MKEQREIKFRCWSPDDKAMYFVNEYYAFRFPGTAVTYQPDYESNEFQYYSTDPNESEKLIIVMQYTGLKDKNGKEIYEGDVLSCHEYDSSDCVRKVTQTFKNAVVGFEKGSFYYYPKGNMKCPHQLLMFAYQPEIIGNIYETPELIKKETA